MAVNKKIPKSRLMIQYDTRVKGEAKKKELPYRLLILGNFSKGKSKDARMAFEDRNVRVIKNGIDATLKDMEIVAKMRVPNCINPQKSPMMDIEYEFTSMADFQPDRIAKKVPELNALLQLKAMLSSFEKDIDNNRALKNTIDAIFSDQSALENLKQNLPMLENFKLSRPETPAEGEVVATAEAKEGE